MVILSVSVCNKKGKILMARQYIPMSRLRIEGLLAAFPKLIDSDMNSSSKQHTFIETDEVRYVYQPIDTLYLLLVTNIQSNILEDLQTLRMIAKLIPEYCQGQDEESVVENSFELVIAVDEVISPMGYREQVNFKDIEEFLKMDSAEEKLNKIIKQSKIDNQKDIMRRKVKELDELRKQQDRSNAGVSRLSKIPFVGERLSSFNKPNTLGSGIYAGNAISSDSYNKLNNDLDNFMEDDNNKYNKSNKLFATDKGSDDEYDNNNNTNYKKSAISRGTMKLGSNKKNALLTKQEKMDRELLRNNNLKRLIKSESLEVDEDLSPVEISVNEKMTVLFGRDGDISKLQILGDLEVTVNNPDASKCFIFTKIPKKKNNFGKINWRLHPRMDSDSWNKGILKLKNGKSFKIGRSSKSSILKWKMSSSNDDILPILIEFWADPDGDGNIIVTANYKVQYGKNKEEILKNVIIVFPSEKDPDVTQCDGDHVFYKGNEEIQWILNDLKYKDEGNFEFKVSNCEMDDLYPISCHFDMEKTYSEIKILSIQDDQEEKFEFSVKKHCVADKYQIE